jgi:DNA-binding NtrC family response regulator
MFFNRHRARFSLPELRLPRPFVERLEAYPWPGNVRQLENAMKQAAVLAEDQVGEDQLPREVLAWVRPPEQSVQVAAPRFNLPEGVMPLWQAERLVTAEVETRLLSEAVAQCKGDRVAAAARLNLHPKTLARKLKDLRIG